MSPFPTVAVRDHSGRAYLTIYTGDGELPPVVPDDHPHFEALARAAVDPEATAADIRELADLSEAVAARFNRLSERVSVAHGRVYFDGDELDNAITRHIVRVLDSGAEDWTGYVLFLENIAANPSDHSREQLFDWLRAHEFTITSEGEIIGYKGVRKNDDGTYSPSSANGYALVDGERQEDIRQSLDSVVELPRAEVVHDPAATCSFGLHVGTHSYAQSFAHNGVTLKVAVNPRDVVSVPTDAGGEKVRACRYRVIEEVTAPVEEPLDYRPEHATDDEEVCFCGAALDEFGECTGCEDIGPCWSCGRQTTERDIDGDWNCGDLNCT